MAKDMELAPDYNFVRRSEALNLYCHIPYLNFFMPVFAVINGVFIVRNYALFNRKIPPFFASIMVTLRQTTVKIVYAALLNIILVPLGLNPFGWMVSKYLSLFPELVSSLTELIPSYLGTLYDPMETLPFYETYLVVLATIAICYYGFGILGAVIGILRYRRKLRVRFEEIREKDRHESFLNTNEI